MSRRTYRPGHHKAQPCGCNPYAGVICPSCQAAYRASETCWFCADGTPVAMVDGKPACEKCSAAVRESSPRLPVAS